MNKVPGQELVPICHEGAHFSRLELNKEQPLLGEKRKRKSQIHPSKRAKQIKSNSSTNQSSIKKFFSKSSKKF